MLRFMLFAGMRYYPRGGWEDYRGSYGSVEEAKGEIQRLIREENEEINWWQIVDSATRHFIEKGVEPF